MPQAKPARKRPDIPGWGSDLDREKRPGYPREANRENVLTQPGNTYDQVPSMSSDVEILVSNEHKKRPPVFGTSCPPKGLSGMVRRFAFRFSEGRKKHWLLLMLADRIDVIENAGEELLSGKLPQPVRDRGLAAELKYHGARSRWGRGRADTRRLGAQALALGVVAAGAVLVGLKGSRAAGRGKRWVVPKTA